MPDGLSPIWTLGTNVQNKFEKEFDVVTVDMNCYTQKKTAWQF